MLSDTVTCDRPPPTDTGVPTTNGTCSRLVSRIASAAASASKPMITLAPLGVTVGSPSPLSGGGSATRVVEVVSLYMPVGECAAVTYTEYRTPGCRLSCIEVPVVLRLSRVS